MRTIATLIISAALPWIGALMAFRSAYPRTTEFLELISGRYRFTAEYGFNISFVRWARFNAFVHIFLYFGDKFRSSRLLVLFASLRSTFIRSASPNTLMP